MMIRSVGYALSWEYWRRGMCWFVPACAALVVTLMAPGYGALAGYADVRPELGATVFCLVCWGPLVMSLASRGFLRRQYTLPVPTGTLVGWTLVNGSLAMAITYWLVAMGLNTFFRAGWPFWGPAWWAVTIYAILQATVWAVKGGRVALLIPVVYLVLLAIFSGPPTLFARLVPVPGNGGRGLKWPALTAVEMASALSLAAGSYLAAVYVVGRDRRGEGWTLAWLSPAWWVRRMGDRDAVIVPIEFTPRRFRSPHAAQFWMEWRFRGRYVMLYVLTALAVFWMVAAMKHLRPDSLSETLGILTGMVLLTSPLWGVYLGTRSDRIDMKPFLATRPLTDGDQAAIVLCHAGLVCMGGAIVWLMGTVGPYVLYEELPHLLQSSPNWSAAAHAIGHIALTLAFFLTLLWTFVGLGVALALGRSWFVPVGGFGAMALLFSVSAAQAASPAVAKPATILLAAGVLAGTLAAFIAARQRRLISNRTVLGALAMYVLILACIAIVLGEDSLTSEFLPRIVGFCAAPLAPVAAAPLALAWNRHR
jgi:hypothetical protein